MACPGGWLLAPLLLGAPAPDDPAGAERAGAMTDRDRREATALARSRAAEVALPAAIVRRRAELPGEDELRVNYQVAGRRVKLILGPRPAGPGAIQPPEAGPDPQIPAEWRGMVLARATFDQLVFPPTHREPNDLQVSLHETLAERVRAVEAGGPLTPAERSRLLLAGTGDIQRFYARVAAARADFEVARLRIQTGLAAAGRLDALAAEYNDGPFGPGSLFRKTLRSIRPEGR